MFLLKIIYKIFLISVLNAFKNDYFLLKFKNKFYPVNI